MHFDSVAARIVDNTQPRTPDRLWLEILASDSGRAWLEAWELSHEQVRQKHRPVAGFWSEVMEQAGRLTVLTRSLECAEYLLGGLLRDRRSALARHLKSRNLDREAILQQYSQSLRNQPQRHRFNPQEAFQGAYDRGREEANEVDYLRVARRVSPQVDELLTAHQVDLDQLLPHAGPFHPTTDWHQDPVEPVHLAWTLASLPEIQQWMDELGVVPARLLATLRSLDPRMNSEPRTTRPMSWLEPASQEARRLGCQQVTTDHLWLGLLSEPRGLVCRVLRQHQVDLAALRRHLAGSGTDTSSVAAADMTFSAEVLEICQQAAQHDGQDPHPAVFLDLLLEREVPLNLPRKAIQESLRQRLWGTLSRCPQEVSIEGVGLGMTSQQVLEQAGSPGFTAEVDGRVHWTYRSLSVTLSHGQVCAVVGPRLMEKGRVVLELGAGPWETEWVLGARFRVPGLVWGLISHGQLSLLQLEET
jgi:hypothetical protein